MSFYDLSKLSHEELIAQFILEMKGKGAFLSHGDYRIIDGWLKASENDPDLILLLLNEEFERIKEKKQFKALPRSLSFMKEKITKKILQAKTQI